MHAIISLKIIQAVLEELPPSPQAIFEEIEMPFDLADLVPPSPARSSSSSSSGSYDLEDAMPEPCPEFTMAPLSGHASEAELDHDVRLLNIYTLITQTTRVSIS